MEYLIWLLMLAIQILVLVLLFVLFKKISQFLKKTTEIFEDGASMFKFNYIITVQETEKEEKKLYEVYGEPKPLPRAEPKIPPNGKRSTNE